MIRGGRAVLAVTALLLAAACAAPTTSASPPASTGSPAGSTSGSTAAAAGTTVTPRPGPPPTFDGTGDFYAAPDPLPPADPGTLIRTQAITPKDYDNKVVLRVMYHSRDAENRDVATTGTIVYPNPGSAAAPAPSAGYPVVSFAHGSTGLGSKCAPSRANAGVGSFGVEGIAVAADFIGLGPTGQHHAFMSGPAEGHSVIDIVRAVRNLADAHAGTRWAAVGFSQGGHASLFAGEQAKSYAPELDLVGVAVAAPPSNLDETYPGDVAGIAAVTKVMTVFGLAVDHPGLVPRDYATPELLAASDAVQAGCVQDLTMAVAAVPLDKHWTRDPYTTEPAAAIVRANSPGLHPAAAPILIVQGSTDVFVVPARTDALFAELCAQRATVDLRRFEGVGHDENLLKLAKPEFTSWLGDRFAGRPAPDTCASAVTPPATAAP